MANLEGLDDLELVALADQALASLYTRYVENERDDDIDLAGEIRTACDAWDEFASALRGFRDAAAEDCDCSFVPGAAWPMATNGDDSLPWVERCDDCQIFPDDEAAAEAIAAKIGGRVMWAKVSGGLSPFVLPTDFPLPAGHPLRKDQP